jgi:hypothetical protein
MRKLYAALAWLVAAGVVVQAASIAFGFGGMVGYVMDGGVVDKALIESQEATFTGDLGFPVHEMVGGLVLPVVGLALGIVSFFVRGVRRARTLAWAVFVLIFVQGSAGYAIADVPYVGLFHGANALLVLGLSVYAALKASRAPAEATADAPSSSVLA